MIAIEIGKKVFDVFDILTKEFDNTADVMEYMQQLEFELLSQKKIVNIAEIKIIPAEATHNEYNFIFFRRTKSKFINRVSVTYMIVKEKKIDDQT